MTVLGSLIKAEYSSLVDKNYYDYPEFYEENGHIYVSNEVGKDVVYADVILTKEGYIVTVTKNGKLFPEKKPKKTLKDIVSFIEYAFWIQMKKKDITLFKNLQISDSRPKDYRKILDTLEYIVYESRLADSMTQYTLEEHKLSPDKGKLKQLENQILRIAKPAQKYKQYSPDFFLNPLKYTLSMGKGTAENPTKRSVSLIEDYYDDLFKEKIEEAYDTMNSYNFYSYNKY